jgi:hypothetical protein
MLAKYYESTDNGMAIDFLSLSFAHGIDCITAMIFGLLQAASFVLDNQKRDDWLALYLRSHPPKLMLWMQELPNLVNWLVGIGIPILSKSYQTAKEELEGWVLEMVDQTENELRETRDEGRRLTSFGRSLDMKEPNNVSVKSSTPIFPKRFVHSHLAQVAQLSCHHHLRYSTSSRT